jgi:alkylation response protein AidB-like acyl-CoA dehydrogenase
MSDAAIEDVQSFRARARDFIRENLGAVDPDRSVYGSLRNDRTEDEELAAVTREREIQRMLYDAGLAGICFPREYGGQGLTPEHQRAFNEEIVGYEYPTRLQAPTISPCAAVLLDFGTEEQKRQHIPAILKGEEIWMQFLSEPSGGSDAAGVLTSAVRAGDEWVLNGSKIWTTGAWWSDWALCLARTNWDVPKHRGLTVFIFPIHQPAVTVHRIEMLNGSKEFCQEYMTDLRVPDSDRVGEVDGGWTVGVGWMTHERFLHSSPLVTVAAGEAHSGINAESLVDVARISGRLDEAHTLGLIGEARTLELVKIALGARIGQSIAAGRLNDQAAAVGRLFGGVTTARSYTIELEIAGSIGAAWTADDGAATLAGNDYLMRQAPAIGGGTLEMARNVISERVLGMPREQSHDRNLAFRDIPRGASNRA